MQKKLSTFRLSLLLLRSGNNGIFLCDAKLDQNLRSLLTCIVDFQNYIHTHTHTQTPTNTHAHTHKTYPHAQFHILTHTHTYTYLHTCTYLYTYTFVYTHINGTHHRYSKDKAIKKPWHPFQTIIQEPKYKWSKNIW